MTEEEEKARRERDEEIQAKATAAVANALPFAEGWHFALIVVRSSSKQGETDGWMGATFDRGLGVDGAAEVLQDARSRLLENAEQLEKHGDARVDERERLPSGTTKH